jgi:transposase-like protein
MKANIQTIQKQRRFSEEYKKSIVREFERGKFTVLELSHLHHVHFQTVYNWIYRYSKSNNSSVHIVEMKSSSTKKVKDLEARIKELERIVGQKQMNIDFLEKMIEIAKDEMGIDIKKNFSTPRSDGSDSTKKK